MATRNEIAAAIQHPDYSHSRAGDGCWRRTVWIYHRDPNSPSGVRLELGAEASEVERMLRILRSNSPLSPTEH